MIELGEWLKAQGLEQYAKVFADNDIDLEVLADLTDDIVAKADGVPLFVEELTKGVLDALLDRLPCRQPCTIH